VENVERVRKRIFSGIQPTGELHLGNYLGAVQNWVRLQDEYDCIYCVVDYHAITIRYDVTGMQERIRSMATGLLAAGLDPARCILFVQSHVREHTELAWVLGSLAGIGHLERMTQFKDKAEQHRENLNLGLLAYPVLQAADILLYKPDAVPVGEDQAQHLELTRDLTHRFNHTFAPVFSEPQTLHTEARRIPGLDGLNKMSKSRNNTISLTDSPAVVWEKLRPAVTDPARKRRSDPGDPHKCPIGHLHHYVSPPETVQDITQGCTTAGIGCIDCKKLLAEHLNTMLAPIQARHAGLAADPGKVKEVLRDGAERARAIAAQTMGEVRVVMGLDPDTPPPAGVAAPFTEDEEESAVPQALA
jgi:tryptophanyl-tRNA synthetase